MPPGQTLILDQWDPWWTSSLQNCKLIKLALFQATKVCDKLLRSRTELTHLPFNSQWHPLTTLSSPLEEENQTHDCLSSLCAHTMHLRRGRLFMMLQSSFWTRDTKPPFSKAHLLPPPRPQQPSSWAPTSGVSFSCHPEHTRWKVFIRMTCCWGDPGLGAHPLF